MIKQEITVKPLLFGLMGIFISPPDITFSPTRGKLVTPNVLLIMADEMGFTDIGHLGAK